MQRDSAKLSPYWRKMEKQFGLKAELQDYITL
jgi:hypothetical protein